MACRGEEFRCKASAQPRLGRGSRYHRAALAPLLLLSLVAGVGAELPEGVSLFFSEYSEGADNDRYLEVFNSGPAEANLADFRLVALGQEEAQTHPLQGRRMRTGSLHIVADEGASEPMLVAMAAERLPGEAFNGSSLLALVYEPDGIVVDVIRPFAGPPETCPAIAGADAAPASGTTSGGGGSTSTVDICGVTLATKGHTIVRKRYINRGNGGHWRVSAGTNAQDCEWHVHVGGSVKDMASHTVDTLDSSLANRSASLPPLSLIELQHKVQMQRCPRYRPRVRIKPRKRVQIRLTKRLKASGHMAGYLRANTRWRIKARPRYVVATGKTVKYRPIMVASTATDDELVVDESEGAGEGEATGSDYETYIEEVASEEGEEGVENEVSEPPH